jgi:ribonuclease J
MNMYVLEYGDTIIVVDCGLMFPEDYQPGVDIVIPDVTYLKENIDKVKAFIITHGHEDHTGALPFVLREVKAPIYATALTIGLIKNKLVEHDLDKSTDYNVVKPRDKVIFGPITVEFIRVSHSIVDGVGLAFETPVGTIVHTGDFKLDQTPVDGEVIDYQRFSEYGERGVHCLMSDSTNVEKEGYSLSESVIGKNFEDIFAAAEGRIIVAAFSSNVHRVQQVFDAAIKTDRTVVATGRSMIANIAIARSLGYLHAPDSLLADLKDVASIPDKNLVVVTTGSQGEPLSALTRMAMDNHKQVKIADGDTVVLSSKFIPGNEKAISNMINHLYRRGAEVIHEKVSEVHVSGHACKEELKIMLNMVKPRFFIPVHGEYRHLVKHGKLAREVCVDEGNVVIAEDGDVVEFTAESCKKTGRVDAGKVFVDGKGVGDVSEMVLKDRRHLSRDGMVILILALNEKTGEVIYGPDVITRGLTEAEESEELIEGARAAVTAALEDSSTEAKGEQLEVQEELRRALRRYFNKALKRKPVILPLILEI